MNLLKDRVKTLTNKLHPIDSIELISIINELQVEQIKRINGCFKLSLIKVIDDRAFVDLSIALAAININGKIISDEELNDV